MKETTRKRIIKQAIACIAQNPNAGLDDIAKAAGVGRATLYRHFKSRAELLVQLKLSAGDHLMDAVGPVFASGDGALKKLVRCAVLMVPLGASLNVSAYFVTPFEKHEDPRVLEKFKTHMDQVRKLCLDLIDEGAITGRTPVPWLVTVLTSLVFAAWEKVESGDIAAKQAPWLVLETFLGGHGTADTITWLNEQKELSQ